MKKTKGGKVRVAFDAASNPIKRGLISEYVGKVKFSDDEIDTYFIGEEPLNEEELGLRMETLMKRGFTQLVADRADDWVNRPVRCPWGFEKRVRVRLIGAAAKRKVGSEAEAQNDYRTAFQAAQRYLAGIPNEGGESQHYQGWLRGIAEEGNLQDELVRLEVRRVGSEADIKAKDEHTRVRVKQRDLEAVVRRARKFRCVEALQKAVRNSILDRIEGDIERTRKYSIHEDSKKEYNCERYAKAAKIAKKVGLKEVAEQYTLLAS